MIRELRWWDGDAVLPLERELFGGTAWSAEVFAVTGAHLGEIRPAATLLVVAGLYKPEMKVEIEVTAKRRA